MGSLVDHYKLLPWMCATIKRANPDSRAFVELEGYRFKRLFVTYRACLNGFILGCHKMLFVDGSHLSGPYEGTLLRAVALDVNNHLFDVTYAVIEGENNDDWLWFLTMLYEYLGGLKPMIMSYRHKSLVYGVLWVFDLQNHNYCTVHVRETFLDYAGKLGIRRNASKDLVKEMFNRVAYAATIAEYVQALEEPRQYKRELARWVEDNELKRWAQSKFTKKRWGKLNNNPVESWNNWMCGLRQKSIPC